MLKIKSMKSFLLFLLILTLAVPCCEKNNIDISDCSIPLNTSACTIYAVLFRKNMTGAYYPGEIEKKTALMIQETVFETLFHCNPD
jgi:hypothetical protein